MPRFRLFFAFCLVLLLILAGGGLVYLYSGMARFETPRALPAGGSGPALKPSEVVFDPPQPQDAPEKIRDAVVLGYNILMDTRKYLPEYVGNRLDCRNCHFDAGRERNTLSLVGVGATYPKFRPRQNYAVDLVTRTQDCMQRSMNGRPLPPEGKEMQAIMAYYHWISKGIPVYAEVPWLGIRKLKSGHQPDRAAGEKVFQEICSRCHGGDGQGTDIAPPVWGPGSYNDGAGMHKPQNFSAFAHHFMPKGNPVLTEEQALDVADFVHAQPRPSLAKK